MDAFYAWWQTLDETGKVAFGTVLYGLIATLIQKAVTEWPKVKWLTPLSSKWTQIGVATIIPVITSVLTYLVNRDYSALLTLVLTFAFSQMAHNLVKPQTPACTPPAPAPPQAPKPAPVAAPLAAPAQPPHQ